MMLATLEEFHFQLSILRLATLFDIKPPAFTNATQLIEAEVIRFKEYSLFISAQLLFFPYFSKFFKVLIICSP